MNFSESDKLDFGEDIDDDKFLRRIGTDNTILRHKELLRKKEQMENEMVKSTERSLEMLENSEYVGRKTAEELLRQGEVLRSTNGRLDSITAFLRLNQRHINNIKSVFNPVKDLLRRRGGVARESVLGRQESTTKTDSREDLAPGRGVARSPDVQEGPGKELTPAGVVDRNLERMMEGVDTLKTLSLRMGRELDDQDILLDSVIDKADNAGTKLADQDKQIKRLIKK